MPHMGYA
jgi:hypothetical protein